MCEWLIKEGIIEYIFQDSNPEMISRTVSLIELLAQKDALTDDHIKMLWWNCIDEHKHEAVVKEILDLLKEIGKKISPNHLDLIFNEIKELKSADEKMVNFIKDFYISTTNNINQKMGTTMQKWKALVLDIQTKWDLDIFWNII